MTSKKILMILTSHEDLVNTDAKTASWKRKLSMS